MKTLFSITFGLIFGLLKAAIILLIILLALPKAYQVTQCATTASSMKGFWECTKDKYKERMINAPSYSIDKPIIRNQR
jgi:hypothetical protein